MREAAKQSRRLRVPDVVEPLRPPELVGHGSASRSGLVLHEEATEPIAALTLPAVGEV